MAVATDTKDSKWSAQEGLDTVEGTPGQLSKKVRSFLPRILVLRLKIFGECEITPN